MKTSIFVGTSVDGFIARADGALDWLPPEGNPSFEAFLATVDTVAMGRATFESVLKLGEWPYGAMPVFVLSSRELELPAIAGAAVERESGEPGEIAARLEARGVRHLYVDGGITIRRFLRAGLIHRLVITRVPVLIGEGIPLFGPLLGDVVLRHVATREYPGGLVESEYEVAG
ncbi:MAG: dihydrofolate reductase family protein [Acidobacteriota bacterium]